MKDETPTDASVPARPIPNSYWLPGGRIIAGEYPGGLDDAHARASAIEERIRRERPEIADVIVHTEP